MAYMGPQPPTGIHRYVFSVFKQKEAMETPRSLAEPRNNFSTRQFSTLGASPDGKNNKSTKTKPLKNLLNFYTIFIFIS